MPTPLFFPRAQFTGILRWSCVYCGKINNHQLGPQAFRISCIRCLRVLVHGSVFHTVHGKTIASKDNTIPSWADGDDEYLFDPIPEAIWSNQPVKRYGRSNLLVLHENILTMPPSIGLAPEYVKDQPEDQENDD